MHVTELPYDENNEILCISVISASICKMSRLEIYWTLWILLKQYQFTSCKTRYTTRLTLNNFVRIKYQLKNLTAKLLQAPNWYGVNVSWKTCYISSNKVQLASYCMWVLWMSYFSIYNTIFKLKKFQSPIRYFLFNVQQTLV